MEQGLELLLRRLLHLRNSRINPRGESCYDDLSNSFCKRAFSTGCLRSNAMSELMLSTSAVLFSMFAVTVSS